MTHYKEYEAQSFDLLQQAAAEHPGSIYQFSSFGEFSVAGLNLAKDAGLNTPVLHNNTGDLHDETLAYRETLQESLGLTIIEVGPTPAALSYIKDNKLFADEDPHIQREVQTLTKAQPLRRAIIDLGITALVSGVRRDQAGRQSVELRGRGVNGEERFHPVAFWPERVILEYIRHKGLPRHPLNERGFKSIGGKHSTFTGLTRLEQRGYDNCPLQAGVA